MIQRQKETNNQIVEIKEILTKNKIIHDKLEKAELSINEQIFLVIYSKKIFSHGPIAENLSLFLLILLYMV